MSFYDSGLLETDWVGNVNPGHLSKYWSRFYHFWLLGYLTIGGTQ